MRWVTTIGATMLALAAPAAAATRDAVTMSHKTPDLDFSYAYPQAAARIAPLRRWLDADRARLRTRAVTIAAKDRSAARGNGFPFHLHDATRVWKVVTETPRLLSLSGETYRFTGGAHGGTDLAALLWDKAAARRVDPRSMFQSPAALQRVLGATWCAKLKAERTRRLQRAAVDDAMFPCPPIAELTLLLGSTNGAAIDRIGLVAGQYVAGSYAEGMYEITLPVDAPLLAIVKPQWRGLFAAGRP